VERILELSLLHPGLCRSSISDLLIQEGSGHVESQRPGHSLYQEPASLGRWAGQRPWLHPVVDSYSSFAFALLHTDKQAAAVLVHNDVVPFFQQQRFALDSIPQTTVPSCAVHLSIPTNSIWLV
jgi:hypothetical protein